MSRGSLTSCACIGLAVLSWAMAPTARAQGATVDAAKYLDAQLSDCGFQKAIDALPKEGGTVLLPEGTFKLRAGLILRDGVKLVGKGMDKTLLTPARPLSTLPITRDLGKDENILHLKEVPEDLKPGSMIILWRSVPVGWGGYNRPAFVKEVDRPNKTITFDAPYGACPMAVKTRSQISYGLSTGLAEPAKRGDTEIKVLDASFLRARDEITLGEPPNESSSQAIVKEVKGNTLVLTEPLKVGLEVNPKDPGGFKINPYVWALHPLIHGSNIKNIEIRDLTVQGWPKEMGHPAMQRYTLAGIHLFNAQSSLLQNVAVRGWPTDGISLQTGNQVSVRDCEATDCLGNGFHPGTGLASSLFENLLSRGNGEGLYFCWGNQRHVIRKCKFIQSKGPGIGGLGNPGDHNSTIEENLIADNEGPGIEINGGLRSGNIIRNNTIENNSRGNPGKFPGILLYASTEDALNYTVTGNTVRDTQKAPTQYVGIEERNGEYNKKPTRADENIIQDNKLSGHKTADIIVVGPKTVCPDGQGKVVRNTGKPTAETPPK